LSKICSQFPYLDKHIVQSHSEQCDRYWKCVNKKAQVFICRNDKKFDGITRTCTAERKAACILGEYRANDTFI